MEKHEVEERIIEASKLILSFCTSHTSNPYDAQDLQQDVLFELMKCLPNIREEGAFYGFMWAVVRNVYKQWCRKRMGMNESELTEDICDEKDGFEKVLDDNSDIYLLRRELALLNEKYRRATILYYFENKSCSEISRVLFISESMVKYLLFKSRKILKEGIHMERNYGEQSYNPKGLEILFWGKGENIYYHLRERKISQNILFACYNDKLTEEQISLELGIALPYMEDELKDLLEYELLKKDGNRYYTNMIIFTKEFSVEVDRKAEELRRDIVGIVKNTLLEKEESIRNIGFTGADMDFNTYAWQMTSILLYQAIIRKLQENIKMEYPVDKFGIPCFLWGAEKFEKSFWDSEFNFGIANMSNTREDYIQFMDFKVNGEMVHFYYAGHQNLSNIFLDIASKKTEEFSENDLGLVADMIKRGYVKKVDPMLAVNVPVFTRGEFAELIKMMDSAADEIAKKAEELWLVVTKILQNHVPVHLKQRAKDIAYLRLFEDAISAPVAMLYKDKFLNAVGKAELLPTTYIILNK